MNEKVKGRRPRSEKDAEARRSAPNLNAELERRRSKLTSLAFSRISETAAK